VDEQTFSVTELNTVIRDALREAIPGEVWVKGEIQGLRTYDSGHAYFQLVEKAGKGERVLSRLDVALFRTERAAVNAALRGAGLKLEQDVQVRVRGRIDYYTVNGKLQLIMSGIDPVFTVGGMAANRARVLEALAADGLMRANGGLPLPTVPLRVGLVTSAGSAAYHDFVHELEASGFAWEVVLADVRVQGGGADKRVVWGLRQLAQLDIDVVALVRGGGSRSDLAPFDTEGVARAVAQMPVPVLTGIGHEVDRSVADEVAHTACKTPTACAQVLVERMCEFVDRLDAVSRGIAAHARSRSALARRELIECTRRLRRGAPGALVRELTDVERRRGRVEELGTRAVREADASLGARQRAVVAAGTRHTRDAARRLDGSEAQLRALDPARVLERGYTITRDVDGRVLKGVDDITVDARIYTHFADGGAMSRVEGLVHDEADPDEEGESE